MKRRDEAARGSQQRLATGDGAAPGFRRTLAQLNLDADEEPTALTMFGIGLSPDSGGIQDCFALLNWGVDGGNFTAEVDMLKGFSVTVIGNYGRIDLKLPTDFEGNATSTFQATAGIALGTSASRAPITRTLRSTVAAAGTQDLTIPAFASQVQILKTTAADDVALLWLANTAASRGRNDIAPGAEGSLLLVPGGCTTLRLSSVSGGVFAAIFTLAL